MGAPASSRLMHQLAYILFGAIFTVAVSFASGKLLFQWLGLKLCRLEEELLAFVAGSACLSLLVFVLSAAQLARKGVFLAVGLTILGLAVRRRAFRRSPDVLPSIPRLWIWIFWPVFTAFTILYFLNALAPEFSPDGSAYHLGLVFRYLRHHGLERITTNMYANLSQGVEMLFLWAFAFGRHSAAALVHFSFLLTLPLLLMTFGRRFGFPGAGIAAGLFVYVSPVVGIDGVCAYIDVALAVVIFAVFYLLQVWDAGGHNRLLVLIGMLAGFGYAVKYTAFLVIPYALGYVGWRLYRTRKEIWKPLITIGVCAFVMMAPWLVRNSIWYCNPFSPFLNRIFPNPYVHVSFEESYSKSMRNYEGVQSKWQLPLLVTTRGDYVAGLVGPLFLLTPLALLALRFSMGRRLLLAALVFALTYPLNIGTRFLIPALPFVSLSLALALSNTRGALAVLVFAHALSAWPPVLTQYCAPQAWRLIKSWSRQAFRVEKEEGFLNFISPDYRIARMIESLVPPGGKVFSFSSVAAAYTSRDIMVSYEGAENERLNRVLWTGLFDDFSPRGLYRFPYPSQALRRLRVVQTAQDADYQWSVTEMRVYHGGRELPRLPCWRVSAQPFPWDVQLAFDNSPVTQWRSWRSIEPGDYIQIDFSKPQASDEVRLECSTDQWKEQMNLEGQDASGRWAQIGGQPEFTVVPKLADIRRAATYELAARGYHYLLVYDSNVGAAQFRDHPEQWGIVLIGERPGARLYHID